MNIVQCFSQSYAEAREQFLAAATRACADTTAFPHPETGPDGGSLSLDAARVGPADAPRVLVIGSATHGVEGFFGSAVQTGLLQDGFADDLPDGVRLLFLHAMNPYGFAHIRRVTEDNVDLNRNFVDHAQPYPPSPEYDDLADALAPVEYSEEAQAAALGKIFAYRDEKGEAALQAAVSGGQYTHSNGLFFGGNAETWSNGTIRAIAADELATASHVVFVDFHTGLGEYGDGEVIVNESMDSPAARRALAWWPERARSTKDGSSLSADVSGPLKLAFEEMCPHAEVTAASLECGTVAPMEVFFAMHAENWLHHHGGPDHPDSAAIKQRLRDTFYADADDWKHMVWDHARTVVHQALAGIAT